MSKQYILVIESLIQTFTVMDSGKKITFSYSTQENQEIFKGIEHGDLILGYYNSPINMVKMLFEVVRVDGISQIELVKKLDVEIGTSIEDRTIVESLAENDIVQITEGQFKSIYNDLIEKQAIAEDEDFEYLYNKENKEFALETIHILQKHGALNDENIKILLSKEKSSTILKNSFPILIRIDENATAEEKNGQLKDTNGRSRYYSDEIKIGDSIFAITNNWYYESQNGRDTRTPYVKWIEQVISKYHVKAQTESKKLTDIKVTASKLPIPYNFLVFGAPGTGKSHLIKELQEQFFEDKNSFERVTFYSNYSYANFVGTYKPKMNGNDIIYSFVPGPFTRVIEKALKNPDKNYLLIVEEINRANPAAVFGDIFQLLDRTDGKSEYFIETSEDLKLYLTKRFVPEFDDIEDDMKKEEILQKFSELYIPANMYIWSTMNSADQGVFPMDTAFKRRWDFKYIGINENSSDSMKNVYFMANDNERGSVKINWNKLRTEINLRLSGPQCRVNEDKLLGPYFISNEVMKINAEDMCVINNDKFIDTFKSKVIMYLFEDAAKQRRSEIFSGCNDFSKFSSVCESFDKIGIEIFGDEIRNNLLND